MKELKKNPNHYEYITTQEFNKWTTEYFAAKLKQAKLATKDDIANFLKKDIFWWKPNKY